MGKSTPFEGELDAFGNPTCGQSFMAGTICSRPPQHEGFCASECQNCGGDWADSACDCHVEHVEREVIATCANCRSAFCEDDGAGEFAYGPCCGCEKNELGHGKACHLLANHDGPCIGDEFGECDNHRSGAGNKYGHAWTPQCRGFASTIAPYAGPTDEELAEVYRSLGVTPPV